MRSVEDACGDGPTKQAKPTKRTKPTKPAKQAKPTEPTKPAKQAKPTNSSIKPLCNYSISRSDIQFLKLYFASSKMEEDLSPIAKLLASNVNKPDETRRLLTPCIARKSASSRRTKVCKKLNKLSKLEKRLVEACRAASCFELLRNQQSTSSNSFLQASVSNAKSKKIGNGQGKQPRSLRKRESSKLGKGKWASKWALSRKKVNARRSAATQLFAHLGSAATCTSLHATFHGSDTCLRCLYQKRQHAWRMMCRQPNGQSWLMESPTSHSGLWALGCSICSWMRENIPSPSGCAVESTSQGSGLWP